MNGAERIAAERERQITHEDYGETHDDSHECGEIIRAAIAYALSAGASIAPVEFVARSPKFHWPWEPESFKPKDPIRDLVRAGALIAAEIDRLLRLNQSEPAP